MALEAGQRVRNVRVERLLGAGGMSEVWRGFDERLRRPVALKVVHDRRRLDPLARARFLSEAQILSSLEHPGICKVYDLEEVAGEEVLLLELVEGLPLQEAQAAGLSFEEKLAVGEGIADALAAAHRHGIVHRDLKPQNVMCTPAGGVKVLDFDLAHRLGTHAGERGDGSSATPGGAIVGTVGYMSPEQAGGDPLTTASDLYSLGIVLHELFTGRRAYAEAPSLEARLLKVSRAETLPVEGVEPSLAELIESLEDPDPERRPPADEVVRRLRALRQRSGRSRRMRPLAGVTAAAALVAAAWFGATLALTVSRPRLAGVSRVHLLPVENRTGDATHDWVGRGLTPMLAEALSLAAGVEAVSEEDRGPPDGPDPPLVVTLVLTRAGAGFDLAAETGVGGRFAGRLQAGGTSPVRAAAGLASALAARLHPGAAPPDPAALLTADPFTDQVFGRGLDARTRGRLAEARDCFRLCLDRDPGFHRARLELARLALAEGDLDGAEALAREVATAASRLGREDLCRGADGVLGGVAAGRAVAP